MDIKTLFTIAALSLISIYALLGFSYSFQQYNNGTISLKDNPDVKMIFDADNLSGQMDDAFLKQQEQRDIFVNQSRTDTNVFSFSQVMESIFTMGSTVTGMFNLPAAVMEGMFGIDPYVTNLMFAIIIATFIILAWRAFRGN